MAGKVGKLIRSDFYIENDTLFKEDTSSLNNDICAVRTTLIMTKEAFIKCYKEWIEKEEDK